MTAVGAERRCRDRRGSGTVVALVVIAASLGGALMWLSGRVDRAISLGTTARIIAFEAARVGAQQVDIEMLRRGSVDTATLDIEAARMMAAEVVRSELVRRGLNGEVIEIGIDGDEVAVVVEIEHAGRRVSGRAAARAVIGP